MSEWSGLCSSRTQPVFTWALNNQIIEVRGNSHRIMCSVWPLTFVLLSTCCLYCWWNFCPGCERRSSADDLPRADAGLGARQRFGHVFRIQSSHCSFFWRKMWWGHGRKFNWTMSGAGAFPHPSSSTPPHTTTVASYLTLHSSSSQASGWARGSAPPAGRGFTGMYC